MSNEVETHRNFDWNLQSLRDAPFLYDLLKSQWLAEIESLGMTLNGKMKHLDFLYKVFEHR